MVNLSININKTHPEGDNKLSPSGKVLITFMITLTSLVCYASVPNFETFRKLT